MQHQSFLLHCWHCQQTLCYRICPLGGATAQHTVHTPFNMTPESLQLSTKCNGGSAKPLRTAVHLAAKLGSTQMKKISIVQTFSRAFEVISGRETEGHSDFVCRRLTIEVSIPPLKIPIVCHCLLSSRSRMRLDACSVLTVASLRQAASPHGQFVLIHNQLLMARLGSWP